MKSPSLVWRLGALALMISWATFLVAGETNKPDIELICDDLANDCVYVDGMNPVKAIGHAYNATAPAELCLAADRIRSRPVMIAFFQRSTLSIAPSSAVVSVQSISAASAAETLAANR